MYLRGYTMQAIANEVGCSRPTVSTDLAAIREEWKERFSSTFDQHVSASLAEVERLRLEHWKAWERTVGVHIVERETTGGKEGGTTSTTTESLAGDPRFLAGVAWCIERRCKILGLDAAKKIDANITGTQTIKVLKNVDLEKI